jgi:hypothetical protein
MKRAKVSNHTYCDTHHEWLFDGEKCKFCVVVKATEERIVGIIDQFIENSDYPEVVSSLQWLQDVIKGENK